MTEHSNYKVGDCIVLIGVAERGGFRERVGYVCATHDDAVDCVFLDGGSEERHPVKSIALWRLMGLPAA